MLLPGSAGLTVVRNDVYARFSHANYNKGTALGEIARQLGVPKHAVFAAGDHLNDIPMLCGDFAQCIVAPDNAVPAIKDLVQRQGGYVSHQPCGAHGVALGIGALSPETPKMNPKSGKTRFTHSCCRGRIRLVNSDSAQHKQNRYYLFKSFTYVELLDLQAAYG